MSRLRRALELFEAVCDLDPPAREAHLAEACADDGELRAEVDALLDGDRAGRRAPEGGAGGGEGESAEPRPPATPFDRELGGLADGALADLPERIGPYRIVGVLGEGGMGLVYEAWQDAPRRRVALKVAHPTALSSERARRLEREARILAQLKHPAIAQVYDSGTFETARGPRPYFAMEYVEGHDVLTHAEERGLDVAERLRLVVAVADALQHAHDHGIIHRDVKPANVLVDAEGHPKVLDFGIARVRDSNELSTLLTRDGQVLGTLAYMAPEQLEADSEVVTARVDVYALGALTYELVTGAPPHDLTGLAAAAAARRVLEHEPARLRARMPGADRELETIVATALSRDPARRYASASDLAADLRALREGRPIRARAPSAAYRLRKYVQRQPAVAAAVVVLALGVASTGFFARRAGEQETRASTAAERLASLELSLEEKVAELEGFSDVVRVRDLGLRADEFWPPRPRLVPAMEAWLGEARAVLRRLPDHRASRARVREETFLGQVVAGLSDERGSREPDWSMANSERRWRHETLVGLIEGLEGLEATVLDVERRVDAAHSVLARSVEAHRREWDAALARIGERSGPYGGLALEPQVGLVPLGPDPRSGLDEFWALETGARPERDGSGAIAIGADTGVVLVLVPGGSFTMGAEPYALEHLDPETAEDEVPRTEVTLAPFLIAKHELTQGQWRVLSGSNPSRFDDRSAVGAAAARHPVESIGRDEAARVLWRAGLVLPTEAQWEFAARAGTESPWWTGEDPYAVEGAGNVADQRFAGSFSDVEAYEEWLDDGYDVHAPVGSFAANPFGLHDVIGNVWEWCRDDYADYERAPRPGDGLREPAPSATPLGVLRGGSFMSPLPRARSAERTRNPTVNMAYNRGVRVARELE